MSDMKLIELCNHLPLDFHLIEDYVSKQKCSPEALSYALLLYVKSCFLEYGEFIYTSEQEATRADSDYVGGQEYYVPQREPSEDDLKGMWSYYLYDLTKLFCRYGLDPNCVYDGENVMWELKYVDYRYVAADTLRVLLEHGGDINLEIDQETLFETVDFDVMFDAIEQSFRYRYESLVHLWMVMVGYGGKFSGGKDPVSLFPNCTLDMLKDHNNLDFCLEQNSSEFKMHIFDKRTRWDIAIA